MVELYHAKLVDTFEDSEGKIYSVDVMFYNNLRVVVNIYVRSEDITDDTFTVPFEYDLLGFVINVIGLGDSDFEIGDCQDESSLADYVNYLIDINEDAIIDYVFKYKEEAMTREEFDIIEEQEGFNEAIIRFEEETGAYVYNEDMLIEHAKDLLDAEDIGQCIEVLEAIYNSDSAVEYYIVDGYDIIPVDSADDLVDYLDD